MNATITGVVYDALPDAPPQTAGKSLATPAGETGAVAIVVEHRDGSPYDLTGCQLLLTVSNPPSSVLISRQATLDNPAAGFAHWPLVVADTVGKSGVYAYDVWLTDAAGDRYQVDAVGTFVVTSALGQPGQAVTAPASQQPLAQGPPGAAGATGATGAQGPKGDQGDPGGSELTVLYNGSAGGPGGGHVKHAKFWKPGQSLGGEGTTGMQWEAWFMGDPFNGANYIISDWYGGAHALLWSGTAGNINFKQAGTDIILSFAGPNTPPPNVFSHFCVKLILDVQGNQYVETYINGISVGKTLIPDGCVRSVPGVNADGPLYALGSDHNRSIGWLAGMRGWDTQAGGEGSSILGDVFIPDRVLTPYSGYGPANGLPADFCVSYVGPPSQTVWPDIGYGYDSNGGFAVRTQHHGAAAGVGDTYIPDVSMPPIIGPTAVAAPSTKAPFYPGYVETPPDRGYTPIAPPAGAKRYDSFSRPDQTYAHVYAPNVGSTESGSLGPAEWQGAIITGANQSFPSLLQLFDRSLRVGDQAAVMAYIPNASDSPDMTVTVTRIDPALNNDGVCSCAARVGADGTTGYMAVFFTNPKTTTLAQILRIDGANNQTGIAGAFVSQFGWSKMSLQCAGNTLSLLLDEAVVCSIDDGTYASQRGAGVPFPGPVPSSTHYAVTDFAVF